MGFSLRPHIKTHKIPEFAHLQIRLGAKGINCQKLGEAEVMVDAGISDILLTYNLIGQTKLDRLVALAHRADIKVVADSRETVEGLSSAMSRAGPHAAGSGRMRYGRAALRRDHAAEALALAQAIDRAPGLAFHGVMTYPAEERGGEDQRLAHRGGRPLQAVRACGRDRQQRRYARSLQRP